LEKFCICHHELHNVPQCKTIVLARHWWLTPVILATKEAETRRISIQSQSGQKVHETLSRKTLHKNRVVGVAQGEDPSSSPSAAKQKNLKSLSV
jgi:hypothetical protein